MAKIINSLALNEVSEIIISILFPDVLYKGANTKGDGPVGMETTLVLFPQVARSNSNSELLILIPSLTKTKT